MFFTYNGITKSFNNASTVCTYPINQNSLICLCVMVRAITVNADVDD